MVTTDAGTFSGQPGADPAGTDTAVVFRGDGEPASPRALLNRLAGIEASSGFEPDSYSLGGSVAALERYFADALGKEAAIFMPTGTLANHLAIRALCGGRPRAVVQEQSHLYQDSGDCVTRLSSINLIPLAHGRPAFHLDELQEAVAGSTSGRVASPVGAVMIESPVRRQRGQVVPYPEMQAITRHHDVHVYPPEDPDAGLTLTINPTILRQPNEVIRAAFTQALEQSRIPL
jgi:threonine aldolase